MSGADHVPGLRIDRPHRRDVDHAAGLDRATEPDRLGRRIDAVRGRPDDPAALAHAELVGRLRVVRRDPEFARRQLDPVRLEPAHEGRPDAGRLERPLDLALDDAGLLVLEDVLEQDLVVVDPVDLGDVDDLARAVLEPGGVDDQVDGRRDLVADRPQRQLVAGHQDHRLEPAEHVRAGCSRGRSRASRPGRSSSPGACRGPRPNDTPRR